MQNLMEQHHMTNAIRQASDLGRAAKWQGLPRNPALVPGFNDAMCGLGADDTLVKAIRVAYVAAYDQVPA
jgi:hypothetical protein